MEIFLSAIVPVYNESKRLKPNLPNIYKFLLELNLEKSGKELILVDDGSKDDTLEILKEFQRDSCKEGINVNIISYEKNRGKGYAIKQGVRQARGQYIFFTDIDLSTPLSFFHPLYKEIRKGCSVVIGSRAIHGSKIAVRQPFLRHYMGLSYYRLLKLLFSMDICDTNCGFKMFSSAHARAIFDTMISERWAFDLEFLFLSEKYGFKVKEVPVESAFDRDTRVRLFSDSAYTLFELLKIKCRDIMGIYPGVLTFKEEKQRCQEMRLIDGDN